MFVYGVIFNWVFSVLCSFRCVWNRWFLMVLVVRLVICVILGMFSLFRWQSVSMVCGSGGRVLMVVCRCVFIFLLVQFVFRLKLLLMVFSSEKFLLLFMCGLISVMCLCFRWCSVMVQVMWLIYDFNVFLQWYWCRFWCIFKNVFWYSLWVFFGWCIMCWMMCQYRFWYLCMRCVNVLGVLVSMVFIRVWLLVIGGEFLLGCRYVYVLDGCMGVG